MKSPPGMGGLALPVVEVLIEEVTEDGRVIAVDGRTRRYVLPLVMRAKGMIPAAGEVWLISRETGYWNLSGVKSRIEPIVSGSRGQDAALGVLLQRLDAAGLIDDQSEPGGVISELTVSASINGSGHAALDLPDGEAPLSGLAMIDFNINANTGSFAWWNLSPSGYGWPLRSGKGRHSMPWSIDETSLDALVGSPLDVEVPGASSGTASVTVSYLSS